MLNVPLPKPISLHGIAGLGGNPLNYESHRNMAQGHNQLLFALGPGSDVSPKDVTISPGLGANAIVSAISGTFKRGKATITCGASGLGANPTISLRFPQGAYASTPFATVVRNGGNGALSFTYSESVNGLTITLAGTPVASTTYTFQWAVRE